jgi:hypothetical protein
MRMFLLLGVPTGGGSPPNNTVAPAINAAAIIGTEIAGDDGTWTPTPDSYTYQWQRLVAVTWGDIAGATNKNYTPVDADFGYALRLEVTATNAAGSTAVYSNQAALTAEAPAQSLGATVILNGTMEISANWDSYNTPTSNGLSAEQAHTGTTSRKIVANNAAGARQVGVPTVSGKIYEVEAWLYVTAGAAKVQSRHPAAISAATMTAAAWNKTLLLYTAADVSNFYLLAATDGTTAYFDDVLERSLTPNVQLVAPSADMRLDFLFELPETPAAGSKTGLQPRINNASLGNYWEAELVYTGSQWNIALYSVALGTSTSRISAANVGTTVGDRVNMNADSISLYTTANGIDWTQRGSTISNNTYQTAMGVNAIWTSDVTPGSMVYAPAS